MKLLVAIFSCFLVSISIGFSQEIAANKVIEVNKLVDYLKPSVKEQLSVNGKISEAVLANYFRTKFSERFFYDWKDVPQKFQKYEALYPGKKEEHTERALDYLGKFSDHPSWKLACNYLNGEPINAYAIRHLARQHKMVDIALYYFYQQKNARYINYFKSQMASLNEALENNKFEKLEDGNGIYESFRAGYRVLNWLQIHNLFLGEKDYSDGDQLKTIATLLQHGANLYQINMKYTPGNHQTRGVSALAMISMLFRDFKGTDVWYEKAMEILKDHLSKEINPDGFQFERSVHYHISDIENYFYVYQLVKQSKLKLDDEWGSKLKSLFTTLVKIAYPDKSAPVLQDDTDNPWAEKNDISGALTLGYLLFNDSEMGYFASENVSAKMYWFLNKSQLELLNNIKSETPKIQSVAFKSTKYFIQREGWNLNDKMMVISAGVDKDKPDHQHGDILGVQAMANGKVILPNYQVRYSLNDLELFKNSRVKNVALVDDELLGKNYVSNKGGSGFGNFKSLPVPKVITWQTNPNFDVFVGSHNGFENIGVKYSRQVIFIKDDFWIVKDNFVSSNSHNYKQVWQGHYTFENQPNLLRATFDDASGCDIFELNAIDSVDSNGARGKQWSILTKRNTHNFSFITIIYPYVGYENRINENQENPDLKGWKINQSKWNSTDLGFASLSKNEENYFFGITNISYKNVEIKFSKSTDIYLNKSKNLIEIQLIGDKKVEISIVGLTKLNSVNKKNLDRLYFKV
ncbi:heparinase II/III family protein [Lutibacter sp.]|uniref:heparinase II/III family protein n=1 Tax=Lutibacter sp. TaxID=1925666 RepID=UPI0025BB2979|nr:heparinase II/III family protein [Lutibacter sp.]MCF6181266.1 heparinase II/III family protein [Lutibacter sp.]